MPADMDQWCGERMATARDNAKAKDKPVVNPEVKQRPSSDEPPEESEEGRREEDKEITLREMLLDLELAERARQREEDKKLRLEQRRLERERQDRLREQRRLELEKKETVQRPRQLRDIEQEIEEPKTRRV